MDVASIKREAAEMIRCATIEVAHQGGKDAVDDFLKTHLSTVIGVASSEISNRYAHQLLNNALKIVEARRGIGG